MKASYADKYGPLGVITVVIGHAGPGTLTIDSWVMSCRAFSRRIEYACLDHLFRRFDVAQIDFNFAVTDRNKPLRDFFAELLSHEPASAFSLPRQMFHDRSVPLFHTIEENVVG
jgi:predicted enzyme involved in methoxymalonyl-ACP biosynthesis